MTVDVVNSQNEKVGSIDVRDDLFGGRVKTDLIWESVTRQNAGERRGTTFGPQPRSYDYQLPKKVEKGALRAAFAQKLKDGAVTVVDALAASEVKTKAAAALLKGLGASGKTLIVDVKPDANFALSVRNLAGVRLLPSNRITARDVMDTRTVIATRAALERLQEVLS